MTRSHADMHSIKGAINCKSMNKLCIAKSETETRKDKRGSNTKLKLDL